MKQKILFQGLVLLTLICLADGILMEDFMSLIVAVFLGFLADLARAGSKPGAPHAEDRGLGSVHHQSVYIRALNRSLDRIAATRAQWRNVPLGAMSDDKYRKYNHAKWTYALLYHRYEEAKKIYDWRY